MREKYSIVLFKNKKKVRHLKTSKTEINILKNWEYYLSLKKPKFYRTQCGKRNDEANYEIALLYPRETIEDFIWVKTELGKNEKIMYESADYKIEKIEPYWVEESIYDFDKKKKIKYNDLLNYILKIKDISQIFTLNCKLFVQTENELRMFSNKNLKDTERLFNLLREDLLNTNKINFIFIKDVSTHQRVMLYNLLEEKGFKRRELFRHYSY